MFAEHAQYRRVNSENVEKIAFLVLDELLKKSQCGRARNSSTSTNGQV